MLEMRTGSPAGTLNSNDLKGTLMVFAGTFLPIFATELLRNIDRIQEISLNLLTGANLPEAVQLMIVPAIISLFIFARQWLKDNSLNS